MQTKREPDISSKFDDSDPLFIDQYLLFFHLMIWWQSHFFGPFLHKSDDRFSRPPDRYNGIRFRHPFLLLFCITHIVFESLPSFSCDP